MLVKRSRGTRIRLRRHAHKVPLNRRVFLGAAFMFFFLLAFLSSRWATASRDQAFSFLDHVMDQYHSSFFVFKEANSGGNHFIPSGWMGDIADLEYSSYDTSNPHSGLTSIRISYRAKGPKGWAGIYWQYPENNWGDKGPGLDLSGATKVTFWARGKNGGEWVKFFVGGINRAPYHNSKFPHADPFGPIGTGYVRLSKDWQKFTIPLDRDYFDIYRDYHSAYFPSGWMGKLSAIEFNDGWTDAPKEGRKAIKLGFHWTGPDQWAGIYWQAPANNWGTMAGGFDLTGYESLTFWAKGEVGGEKIIVKVGGIPGPFGDSLRPPIEKQIVLTPYWKKYTLDLTGKDLSHVIGGFCIVTNDTMCPGGCTIYLDDIRFERPLPKEALKGVIGGFGVAFEKEANPLGATIFLDDIEYDKPRLDEPRLLQSFVIEDPLNEAPLANAAYTYDNALAMLAYLSRGLPQDIERARLIGKALAYAQRHDPIYSDGRLRNAYRAGELFDLATGKVLLPGWWSEKEGKWFVDSFCYTQHTGNMAWALLAWLRYQEVTGSDEFLQNCLDLAQWLLENTRDTRGEGGFTGGVALVFKGEDEGAAEEKLLWKSTEHNLDLYVAFKKLYQLTGDEKWLEASNEAKNFVLSMWSSAEKHFWTGTLPDGETINKDVIPTDCQTWGLLSLRDKAFNGMPWAEENNLLCPKDLLAPYCGFDFNSNLDGVWFEGTAQAAVAYRFLKEADKARYYLTQLERAQRELGKGSGGLVAAWPLNGEKVDTGFGWDYFQRLHVGATAWYIFAKEAYNPYWGEFLGHMAGDVTRDGEIDIVDALFVARYVVGLSVSNFDASAADVNCDGKVDIIDALFIARKAVGLPVTGWCGG